MSRNTCASLRLLQLFIYKQYAAVKAIAVGESKPTTTLSDTSSGITIRFTLAQGVVWPAGGSNRRMQYDRA